jgi:DNA-binding SARP family transcriptional activator
VTGDPVGLEITLLRTVAIRRTGPEPQPPVVPSSAQVRLALTVLTLERRHAVTRGYLADALWPDELPVTWAPALRAIVSKVRTSLASALATDGSDVLVARADGYRLRVPDDTVVDVETAELQVVAAQRAFAADHLDDARQCATMATNLLLAPFLPEHDGDWVSARREHLSELLVTALELASRTASVLGDAHAGLVAAQEAVRRAPLRESAHRCLMAAHAAAGNRTEALCAYQRLRRALSEEVGADPDAETEATYLELLGPVVLADRLGTDPGCDVGRRQLTRFVGRAAELAAASELWTQTRAGTSELLLVGGETGVGKTRFVAEFAQRVSNEGGLVLFGHCDPDSSFAYQPFVEMLGPLVASIPDDELVTLSRASRAELAVLFPAFAARSDPPDAPDRSRVVDVVAEIFQHAALDHALVVVVDDFQWADHASVQVLSRLPSRLRGVRVLLVAVARDDLPPHLGLGRAIEALEHTGQLRRLRLAGLEPTDGRALAAQLLPEGSLAALTRRLTDDCAGNPLMLAERIRAAGDHRRSAEPGAATSSPRLREIVTQRLLPLGSDVRALLEAAAASGRHFEHDITGAAAGLDTAAAVRALDAALASGLVVEVASRGHASRYRFTHEVIRQTLYDMLSRPRRSLLHGHLADTIEDLRPDHGAGYLNALAFQRCAAADGARDILAARGAMSAAGQAKAGTAEVVRWCREALQHVAREDRQFEAEILIKLGLAQLDQGDRAGQSILSKGVMQACHSDRVGLAARGVLDFASLARHEPQHREAALALVRGLLKGDASRLVDRGSPLPRPVWASMVARQLELGPAVHGIPATALETACRVLVDHLGALEGPDTTHQRLSAAEDLRIVAEAVPIPAWSIVARHHQAMAAALVGDVATTDSGLAAMAEGLRLHNDTTVAHRLDERAIAAATTRGRFADVWTMEAEASSAEELGVLAAPSVVPHQLAVAAWLQGNLRQGGEPAKPVDDDGLEMIAAAEGALAAVGSGDRGAAAVMVREILGGPLAASPKGDLWLHTVGLLSLVAADLDDELVAGEVYDALSHYDTVTCGVGYRSFVGTAALHLGRLAAVATAWADAERHLTYALRQLAELRARPWIALAQDNLAAVLDARGRSSDRRWIVELRTEAQRQTSDQS